MTKTRRMWTDQEKEEMLLATESLGPDEARAYLEKHGIKMELNSLRTLGTRYLKKNPGFQSQLNGVPAPALAASPVTEDFREADKTRKRHLVAEFRSLPNEEKEAWLKAHNVKRALVHYYAIQFKQSGHSKPGKPKSKPSKALAVRQAPIEIPVYPMPSRTIQGLTLAEAITAMEVKRDHYSEFIADLKRLMTVR